MILHGRLIREMVGVIPRYCPAVTSHVTRRDSRGRRRGGEERRMEDRMCWERERLGVMITVWEWDLRQVQPGSPAGWPWLDTDNAGLISSQQWWVAARDQLYLYNNINNNNTSLGHRLYLHWIVPWGIVTATTMIALLILSLYEEQETIFCEKWHLILRAGKGLEKKKKLWALICWSICILTSPVNFCVKFWQMFSIL